MSFTQKTYFGASIRGFTGNIGWNDTPSTLSVQLVEDPDNGDSFQEPGMGTPAFFNYDGWVFNGIVQDWQRTGGSDGSPLYNINVSDPREILDGVELILDGYTGATSNIPNLINVYGYLEALSFGASRRNESGIPWINVRSVTQTLTSVGTSFGGPIQFRGSVYAIDLTGLQLVPETYRIGGDSISLLGFIQEMCDAASADFFITLTVVNNVNMMVVNTISRRTQPTFGKINQFITNTEGATAKQVGFELRNETTSKFVSGGQKQEMFFQTVDVGNINRGDDDTIAPYWGKTLNGDIAVGNGFDDEHEVTLDSRMVDVPGVGITYTTDVEELRAAMESQVSWENFLAFKNDEEFRLDEDGEDTDARNPHYKKAERLRITGNAVGNLVALLRGMTLVQLQQITPGQINNVPDNDPDVPEEAISRMYKYVHEYANKYYGRQFMVRVPFVSTTTNDNDQLVTSREPTDAGFVDESDFGLAISNNLMPQETDQVTIPDGRLQAYVRFDGARNFDFSQLDPSDIVMNRNRSTFFVKCTVQPDIVFLNKDTKFSPRVVIELPSPVFSKNADFDGVLRVVMRHALTVKGDNSPDASLRRIFGQFGSDSFAGTNGGAAILPSMAAVPLRSNIDSYGPWSAVGAQGKVEFEKDDTLVPWNYAGFTAMNAVGSAKVQIALANQQVAENGSIEVPGTPAINLGSVLINGGPYVTSVDVTVGSEGVTTAYRMNTWSPEFGRFAKQRAGQIQKIAKKAQNDRRNARENKKFVGQLQQNVWRKKQWEIVNRKNSKSSHQLLCGDNVSQDPEDTDAIVISNVVTLPTYNSIGKTDLSDPNKAGLSMDGIFRPFSNRRIEPADDDEDASPVLAHGNLSHYTAPSGDASAPTLDDLDPFPTSSVTQDNFAYITEFGGDDDEDIDPSLSPMALRGPVIISGWGYDVNNVRVPEHSDYLTRPDLWKTGPLDARWDAERGVWVASGGSAPAIRPGVITEVNEGDLEGKFSLINDADPINIESIEEEDLVFRNYLNIPVCLDQKVWVTKVATKWHLVNAEYTGLDVVTDITCDESVFTPTKRTIYLSSAFGQEKICDGEDV